MKKIKLLLSLTMMCLSIAVLCFGVLSATSVTYNISGKISYTVTDVFAKINTSVYGFTEQQDKADVIEIVKEMENIKTLTASIEIGENVYERTQTMKEYDSWNADSGDVTYNAVDSTDETKGLAIEYGDYKTFYIVINIQNLSPNENIDAIIKDNTTAELNSVKTTNQYLNDIEYNKPRNIVIAYSIIDLKSSIKDVEISYALNVSYQETPYTSGKVITKETVNNTEGYYITLGKNKSTDEAYNVKWRLVSLDGLSCYDYTATGSTDKFDENDNARYLSDAVFVQESLYIGTTTDEDGNEIDEKCPSNGLSEVVIDDWTNVKGNYFDSKLRQVVKSGGMYNLTEEDDYIKSGYIKARTLGDMRWACYTGYNANNFVYPWSGDNGVYASAVGDCLIASTNKGKDYFWLMSMEEMFTYFGDELKSGEEASYKDITMKSDWKVYNGYSCAFVLRTPCYMKNYSNWICCASVIGGKMNSLRPLFGYPRAAFQLF